MFTQDQITILSTILGRDLSKEVSWFMNARAKFGSALTTDQQLFVSEHWPQVDVFLASERGRAAALLSLCLACTPAFADYYVYHLVDPRDGKPFYVGKGKNGRMNDHEREAEFPKLMPSAKDMRIREIHDSGERVKPVIIKRFDCEADAYDLERKEIKRLRSQLTNVYSGSNSAKAC